jgi:drug/metabolite transporter (DMT)-like permease
MSSRSRDILTGLLIAFATVSFFAAGLAGPLHEPDRYALGIVFALFSAIAWALSTIGLSALLNLFAALLAAASAGFLASPDKVCAWHHLPLLCP